MKITHGQLMDPSSPFGGMVFRGLQTYNPGTDWRSRVPNANELENILANPALLDAVNGLGQDPEIGSTTALKALEKGLSKLAYADYIDGVRQTMASVAQTTGILSSQFNAVSGLFSLSLDEEVSQFGAMTGLKLANKLYESPAIQAAIDALSAVPIYGWIIKGIWQVSNVIADVVQSVNADNDAKQRREVAARIRIPYGATQLSQAADEWAAQRFFQLLQEDPELIVRPGYVPSWSSANLGMKAAGVDSGKTGWAAGWIVQPGAVTEMSGLGFVPGTTNVTQTIYLGANLVRETPGKTAQKCGAGIRDLGSLYPSMQNLCSGWWGHINQSGPAMFSINPNGSNLRNAWENYMGAMYLLARDLLKGWGCAPTGIPFTNTFNCTSDIYSGGGSTGNSLGSCKGSGDTKASKNPMKLPAKFGEPTHATLYNYLCKLYFGVDMLQSGAKNRLPRVGNSQYTTESGFNYYGVDALNFGQSAPLRAFDVLYENQKALLDSIQCMYVNPDDLKSFPAFKDSALKSRWTQGVTNILNSSNWRKVSYAEMPGAPETNTAKKAFRNLLIQKGYSDYENFNRPCRPGEPPGSDCGFQGKTHLTAGSIPLVPTQPTKPSLNTMVIASQLYPGGGGGGGMLLLAAAALGIMMMKNKRR